MSALSTKELSSVLDSIKDQGARLERTKKGYLVKFPNGDSTTFHLTNSDNRSTRNMRATVRRAGLSWPFDARKDPGMDPRTQRTYDILRKTIESLPEKFTMDQLLTTSGKSTGPAHRYLHDHGYIHRREHGSTYWMLEKPLPVPVPTPPTPEPTPEPPAPAEVDKYPEIRKARELLELQERVKASETPAAREFIDTVESWTVSVPEELQTMAEAMGLQIEVRVWREDVSTK